VTGRINLITPFRLYCCGPGPWEVYTRAKLQAWIDAGSPVVALHVAPGTGVVSRLTEIEAPELRTLARVLAETDSWQTLDGALVSLMEKVVRKP
jgi:hypothetical protein